MAPDFVLYIIFNTLFVLAAAPLWISVIKKVKAWTQGRQGPSVFQTYYMVAKLLRKEVVYSSTSSRITRFTPLVTMAAILTAALFVPLIFVPEPAGGIGNIILFLYLLALARFFMALAGLDAGSTFGGMGSSREMSISAIIEPTTIIVFAALAFVFRTTNIFDMFARSAATGTITTPILILIGISLFIILIVETSRIPVDNPETHLELTMIHEGMILEQSGRNLALMELAAAVKLTVLMALLINLIVPFGLATTLTATGLLIAAVLFVVKGTILAGIIGLFESSMAKMRFFQLPSLFAMAFFFSALIIIIEVFA
ncbi:MULTISPECIES: respiratory chain complex I subunit 1 family protein [unclassified Methanoregula]|uniref:respiratory chain complex I subunit 1 family protein n=1 Tax=unclassified Methanoregula TaxID=2649730 RepID=UPI0009CDF4A8|nr:MULTISPECIES: NADH-quinone oxidoreductase subunit H [unclassified Methanoregula]OPX62953.1 MAG: NADH:ubiquinone oxidoreductase subunit H [Methanoregula sp. PtaB.Bin085]OPY35166.1 MAG: NADH:ubiquinone oxidoreductase subunit H [Methanoregula sp. PtaU1.Bin006]